jgi:hypothetical protein
MAERLVTDENSAMMVAVPEFIGAVHSIKHYVSVEHKHKSINKCLSSLHRQCSDKDQLLKLAGTVCLRRDKEAVDSVLGSIPAIEPRLRHYINSDIRPFLSQFADAFQGIALAGIPWYVTCRVCEQHDTTPTSGQKGNPAGTDDRRGGSP